MQSALARMGNWSFNAYTLKMIAIVTMLVDHVGAVFFPEMMVFRMVGRLAAPIFAFFIAEGYRRTGNANKYLLRLILFALISMVPYGLIFGKYFNILFDFAIALAVFLLTQIVRRVWQRWAIVLAGAVLAYILQTDGMLGMSILVYLFYIYRDKPKKKFLSIAALYLVTTLWLAGHALYDGDAAQLSSYWIWIRPLALLSLPLLFSYNGQQGRKMKYLFYWFYPLHLLALYVIYGWLVNA